MSAAILEDPHKLILPGEGPPLPFDISDPAHEHRDHDRAARKPELTTRLRKKLDAWLATLNPPGPPEPLAPHRARNFVDHKLLPSAVEPAAQTPPEPERSIQGWICRNGTIDVKDALHLQDIEARFPSRVHPGFPQ